METGLQKYILLNDRVGEHVEKPRFGSKKTIPSRLLRGEILECLPKSKQPKDPEKIALRLMLFSVNIDVNIKLECPKLGVSALTDSEADLLLAVSSLEERFRIYRDERNLLQQSNLDVGYKVFVRKGTKELPGIIWYKGQLPVHNGTVFGVELIGKESEGQGTCDGTFRNKKYFDCPADRGVFVAIDALRPRQEQDKSPQKETLSTLKDMIPSFSNKDTSAVRSMAKGHKLKIDQRVVVFPENDDDKVPLRGKVRYISERIDSHGDCPVGIELDRRKGSATGVFKGKNRFVGREGNALFVPVTSVIPEEVFDCARTENSQETSSSETDGLRSSIGTDTAKEHSGQKSYGKSAELAKNLDEERKIREEAETRLRSLEQPSHELETSLATERQAHEETKRRLLSNEQRSHDLETSLATERQAHEETIGRLRSNEQRSHDLETSLASERQAHEETHGRLCSHEQRSHDLEMFLATEKQAHEETKRRLRSNEQRLEEFETSLDQKSQAQQETERRLRSLEQTSHELETSLATERQAHEETKRRLRSNEQRLEEFETSLNQKTQAQQETERHLRSLEQTSHELETSLATERQAHEETNGRLRSNEQRSYDLETSLATERQAHKETVRLLRINQQRLEELETLLVEETQAHQETESRLQSSEERLQELETTLTNLRQTYEAYRRSRESTRDWVLRRDEVILSDKVIGIGAWGEVKEGTFRGCKVAVKKIHQLILSDHNRRLFEREMNMASRCRHPCLLQFIGATNDDQSPLFVTELLDTSLRAVLHDRALEPPEITTIALDVAKGLNYLHLSHPAPIIHRDISSANVLLWKRVTIWRAKVSDYGTANFLQQSMTISPGAMMYSAPEAQTSRQSPKLDVYSFGVLLCEMNIREMPYVDHRNEQVDMVTNSFFRKLIRRCLEQNPEERPSMAEIIEALENSPQ